MLLAKLKPSKEVAPVEVLLSVLLIVLFLYLMIGCMFAIAMVMEYLFCPEKAPPFWAPFLVMVAWGPFMLWAFLVNGRKSKES